MYYLSTTPFTLNTLEAFYQAQGCTDFTKESLNTIRAATVRERESVEPGDQPTTAAEPTSRPASTESSTQSHQITPDELQRFTQALIDTIPEDDDTAYALEDLVAKIDTDDETVNDMALQVLIARYHDILDPEDDPITLLQAFPGLWKTPIQMAAALSILIKKNISLEDIGFSELLQSFAEEHDSEENVVEKAYALLGQLHFETPQQRDIQAALLRLGSNIPKRGHVSYPYEFWNSLDQARFASLYERLGIKLIEQALFPSGYTLTTKLKALLDNLPIADIQQIYQHFTNERGTPYKLLRALSEEKSLELLRTSTVSPWALLASKPMLIKQLTSADLDSIRQPLSDTSSETQAPWIAGHDILNAYLVASHVDADPIFRDEIYLAIAERYQADPGLELPDNIAAALRDSDAVQAWVAAQVEQVTAEWRTAATRFRREFTAADYNSLVALIQPLQPAIQHLQTISHDRIDFPTTEHQQDAFILASVMVTFLPAERVSQLESILSIMVSQDSDKEATRLLCEALSYDQTGTCLSLLIDRSKPYRAHINRAMSDSALIRAFATCSDEQYEALSTAYRSSPFRRLITNREELNQTLVLHKRYPNSSQGLLERLREERAIIWKQLNQALRELNERQCERLLKRFGDDVRAIITDDRALSRALEGLNEVQASAVLNKLPNDLNQIIKDAFTLGQILKKLNPIVCRLLLDKLGSDLNPLVRTELGSALQDLNYEQGGVLLSKVFDNFRWIIQNREQLCATLDRLNTEQKAALLDRLPRDLSALITSGTDLGMVLMSLPDDAQRDEVLSRLPGNLMQISTSLGFVLGYLNERQCDEVLSRVQDNLTHHIRRGKELGNVLMHINEAQREFVLGKLPDLSGGFLRMDGYGDLSSALQYLTEDQRTSLLTGIAPKLNRIITDPYTLSGTLRHLNEAQCNTVLDNLSGLNDMLSNSELVQHAFVELNPVQSNVLLQRLPETLQKKVPGILGAEPKRHYGVFVEFGVAVPPPPEQAQDAAALVV